MFNFNTPFEFYLPEIAFTSLSLVTILSLQIRKQKRVRFVEKPEIYEFETPPKLYIQVKDVIIDTYSANPKRDPGNVEKMDPIGHSIQSVKKLSNDYTIYFIYESYDEVWWMKQYFGNEIIKKLKTFPKNDGIFISTKPEIEFPKKIGEFIRFGNGNNWPEIANLLLKKIKQRD